MLTCLEISEVLGTTAEWKKDSLHTYIGHILSKDGVNIDPKKIKAIVNMPYPENGELQRFLGIWVNLYLIYT